MPIPAGTRLEHYEVIGPLGAGGMGEVYRARDSRLKRDVALKILPAQFVRDPSRLARFEREAHVLAQLNHPAIAAIYGFEHDRSVNLPEYADGARFLVLELVEGQTLAERLASGRLSVPEALRIAAQIAEAMEAAHDKGVLHRDLKPANVKLTPDGKVKVLDFGLAKALGEPDDPLVAPVHSSTITAEETRAGVVIGTAAYMSPEQASGSPTDKRTDIWSFGAVLFEMLCGRKAFDGKTTSHIIVNVLEQTPDWSALPPVPPTVREVLEGCLQKDPSLRRRDIGDVRIQLQAAISKPVEIQQPRTEQRQRRWLWPSLAAALVTLVASGGIYVYLQRDAPAAPVIRFEVGLGGAKELSASVISPDGNRMAFIARAADGRTSLWIRSMDTSEAHPLAGTEGANGYPFWSTDSRYVVFGTDGQLKKIEAAGGPPQILARFVGGGAALLSGLWTSDDRIVYRLSANGQNQIVSANGGEPVPLSTLPAGWDIAFPSLLPDGTHFLFVSSQGATVGIFVASLAGPVQEPVRLLPDVSAVAYASSPGASTGYLLFVRTVGDSNTGALMAQPIDPRTNQLTGDAVSIVESVSNTGFSVSKTGILVHSTNSAFAAANATGTSGVLTWFDRSGNVLGTVGQPRNYSLNITLSPDNRRVVTAHGGDLWVFEFARGVETRLTFEQGGTITPQWTRDSKSVMYAGERTGVFEKPADGAVPAKLFFPAGTTATLVGEWSPNGRFLSVSQNREGGVWDIHVVSAEGTPETRKPKPLVQTRFSERGPRFSRDGRYFSYTSDETGRDEAYVRPFDAANGTTSGGQWMISRDGGTSPHWRGDGKEILYMDPGGTLMSVEIDTRSGFQPGAPKPLFKAPARVVFWDVTNDGQRFLIPVPESATSVAPYNVVLNWMATLKH